MPVHVQLLEEGEGDQDMPLGVIWSYYWQLSQKRDRRAANVKGGIDPGTGLPVSANDLRAKSYSDAGTDMMFTDICPPVQLARTATRWWKDGWSDDKVQMLAHTHRDDWTEEMLFAYEENLRRIKRKIHRLAEDHGWFNVRPINPNDAEMSDLDWVGADGLTIGFRITHSGWEECQRWIREHPIWDKVIHVLDVAPEEIKQNAPDWYKREYENSPAFEVGAGGFDVQ